MAGLDGAPMNPSGKNRALPLVMTGLVSGLLGTIPLSRLPRAVRIGYVVIPAALSAGTAYIGLRSANHGGPQRPPAAAVGWSVALGGLSSCAGAAGLRIDRAIEEALTARRVPAPRLVMGLATGTVMTALMVLEPGEHRTHPTAEPTADLSGKVLEVLTALDPYALEPGAVGGALADEYSSEAASVAEVLERDGGISAAQLDAIWTRWFSEPLSLLVGGDALARLIVDLNVLTSSWNAR